VSVCRRADPFDGDSTANPVTTIRRAHHASAPLTVNTGLSNTQNGPPAGHYQLDADRVQRQRVAVGAQTVDVSIENLLSADTTAGNSEALIQKKAAFGGVGLTVTPVPLPAAVWLFASGITALGFACVDKSRAMRESI